MATSSSPNISSTPKQEVFFPGLVTNISIAPEATFNGFRFKYASFGSKEPKTDKYFPDIKGLYIEVPNPGLHGEHKLLQDALYYAEEIMTALVASTQAMCYLEKPITCIWKGKTYQLEDGFWREPFPNSNTSYGGGVFLSDAPYLNENANFHPMYHLYRAAKDELNSKDYRVINAWRFLEALHGKQGKDLLPILKADKRINKKIVDNFYDNYRCAASHGTQLAKDPESLKVIVPRSYETEFDGGLYMELSGILDYLDEVVASLKPTTTTIKRF